MHLKKCQQGVGAIMVAMVILIAATVMTFFNAQVIITDQKIFKNHYDKLSAENAAKAGFSYALAYLNLNRFFVTEGLSLNAALANGSSYTVTYTFLNGDDSIRITSIGKSADTGASTGASRTVQATVNRYILGSYVSGGQVATPTVTKGAVSLSHSAVVTNNQGNNPITTIKLGGSLSISQNAHTVLSGVTVSDKDTTGSDIHFDSNLASLSDSFYQTTYLGIPLMNFSSYANDSYDKTTISQIAAGPSSIGGGQTAYSVSASSILHGNPGGVSGKVVYIDLTGADSQNLIFENGFQSGADSVPTTFVVIGNVYVEGTSNDVMFEGNVYATGTVTVGKNVTFIGFAYGSGLTIDNNGVFKGAFVIGSGGVTVQKSAQTTIDSAIAELLQKIAFSQYGIVPGSWQDF